MTTSSIKVLLVDDQEEFHEQLRFALSDFFDFICVESVPLAINHIMDSNFEVNLILIDLKMGKTDENLEGFELMKMVKKEKSETPFIAITNSNDYKHTRQAWKIGAYDYIYKGEYEPQQWKYVFYEAINERVNGHQKNGTAFKTTNGNLPKNTINESDIRIDGDFHLGDIINVEFIQSSSSEFSETHFSKGSIQKHLRILLQKGEVKQTLEALLRATDRLGQELSDEVLYLCARWNRLNEKLETGIYSSGDVEMYKNRIVKTLIGIINRLALT